MEKKISVKWLLAVIVMISIVLPVFPAAGEYTYYEPITKIDLGVKKLELNVGETYTFRLTYEPKETPAVFLSWLTDDSILRTDPENFSVTAIAAGTGRLLVESNGGYTWDLCDITVKGPEGKDAERKMAGVGLITLSNADREKITAKSVRNYISFLEMSDFTADQYDEVTKRSFNVTAIVKSGAADPESRLALSLGMEKALSLPDLDAVSMYGTITQILDFTAGNPDLIKIIEFAPMSLTDPLTAFDTESIEKGFSLGSHVEALTSVSVAHKAGFTGAGTAVAILDTGLNKDHEQFKNRVVAEACYAQTGYDYVPACSEGSSEPSLSKLKSLHNHGSHVTGIAAGKDGIAPDAKIVSVNISSENCNGSSCVEVLFWNPYEVTNYLVGLQKDYRSKGLPLIASVNMSFGSGSFDKVCDSDEAAFKKITDQLLENDIIPVAASGNGGLSGHICAPACVSNIFSVGALETDSVPTIANFSNHSNLVDILAPGTKIQSAIYVYQDNSYIRYVSCADGTGGKKDCYGVSQGTSMATPMVTGAFAVLRQAYPAADASQLESIMLDLSIHEANKRKDGTSYNYSKPVLNFAEIGHKNTCGTNVKYTHSDNTIIFSKADPSSAAVWGPDCGEVFRNDPEVKIMEVHDTIRVKNGKEMFSKFQYIQEMYLSNLDVSAVKDMSSMFRMEYDKKNGKYLTSLKKLDVSGWDTSSVTSMYAMFYGCSSLTAPDVSGWNTSGVTTMHAMFYGCGSLTALDLSKWNTSGLAAGTSGKTATSNTMVFSGCDHLRTLTLGKNTLRKNIFGDLPAYNDEWYYITKGNDATKPLALNTVKKDAALFTSYNYNTMAGTWSANRESATAVKIMNSAGTDVTGKTITIKYVDYHLKAAAVPANALQNFTWNSSAAATAVVDQAGKVTFRKAGTVTITASAVDGSKKTASVKITYSPKAPVLEIKDSNVRGKNKEIQVVIPWGEGLSKVECKLYDDETGKQVSPLPTYRERMDANKQNRIISFVGNPLANGHVYRMEIRVWNGAWSNTVKKYGMPIPNVWGATVVAADKTMVINTKHREPCSGTRYMIFDTDTGKEIAYRVGTKLNTSWTYGKLTNGKLYYVVAVPYRDYKGQRLWGPNENRIYFVPLSFPSKGEAKFSGNTTAVISVSPDVNADGIRVLYREIGGKLINGCEGAGIACAVNNLNKSSAYEFYAMKYKIVEDKKYYSMGTLITFNEVQSDLKAPQMNPTVAMSNSGNTTFTIRKAAEAEGISVLYREGEGAFKQACEKAGNSCNAMLDVKANYTFYIMQYKSLIGVKVYSPGIVVRDFSSGKSIGLERLYTKFDPADGSITPADIADALGSYLTEEELLMVEANAAMGIGIGVDAFLSMIGTPAAKGIEDVPVPAAEISAEPLEFYRLEETPYRTGPVPGFGY